MLVGRAIRSVRLGLTLLDRATHRRECAEHQAEYFLCPRLFLGSDHHLEFTQMMRVAKPVRNAVQLGIGLEVIVNNCAANPGRWHFAVLCADAILRQRQSRVRMESLHAPTELQAGFIQMPNRRLGDQTGNVAGQAGDVGGFLRTP